MRAVESLPIICSQVEVCHGSLGFVESNKHLPLGQVWNYSVCCIYSIRFSVLAWMLIRIITKFPIEFVHLKKHFGFHSLTAILMDIDT